MPFLAILKAINTKVISVGVMASNALEIAQELILEGGLIDAVADHFSDLFFWKSDIMGWKSDIMEKGYFCKLFIISYLTDTIFCIRYI